MRRRNLAAAAALAGILAAAAVPALGASPSKTKTRTVKVVDDAYLPAKITVAKGTRVKFVWDAENFNTHDVKLKSGPKHVKKFKSPSGATGIVWSKHFTTPGLYKLYCIYHEDVMKMQIRVKH